MDDEEIKILEDVTRHLEAKVSHREDTVLVPTLANYVLSWLRDYRRRVEERAKTPARGRRRP